MKVLLERFAGGHTVNQWHSGDMNLGLLLPGAFHPNTLFRATKFT